MPVFTLHAVCTSEAIAFQIWDSIGRPITTFATAVRVERLTLSEIDTVLSTVKSIATSAECVEK